MICRYEKPIVIIYLGRDEGIDRTVLALIYFFYVWDL